MSGMIAAAGVAVVGNAIVSNQNRQAAKGAANAQKSAANAATDVERERLQMEYQQYQQQMQEYKRKQAMAEKQMQQATMQLAPYIQGGQSALYEMMALTGMAAPTGATMPSAEQPTISGIRAAGTLGGGTTGTTGQVGVMGGTTAPQGIQGADFYNQAAQEFQKGGRSLSSKAWQTTTPTASPRAAAASYLQQAKTNMPNATLDEQIAQAKYNAELQGQQITEQDLINEARSQVPTVESATSPYAGMTGQEAQAAAIEKVSSSPLLQELMAQGETGILQNQAATGGLRGGRTQAALAQFRPQMLQNEIDKLYSRLQGISGMGQQSILSAPTTATGTAPTYSGQSQIPSLLQEQGAIQAGNILSQAKNQANLYSNIGQAVGWGLEKYAGSNTGGWGGGGIGGASSTNSSSSGNAAIDWGY